MRKLWPYLVLGAVFLAGAIGITFGCWLAWRPLGFIVGGLMLAGTAAMLAGSMGKRRL